MKYEVLSKDIQGIREDPPGLEIIGGTLSFFLSSSCRSWLILNSFLVFCFPLTIHEEREKDQVKPHLSKWLGVTGSAEHPAVEPPGPLKQGFYRATGSPARGCVSFRKFIIHMRPGKDYKQHKTIKPLSHCCEQSIPLRALSPELISSLRALLLPILRASPPHLPGLCELLSSVLTLDLVHNNAFQGLYFYLFISYYF